MIYPNVERVDYVGLSLDNYCNNELLLDNDTKSV